METEIILHIVELGLFLIALGLTKLVNWREPRSRLLKVLIVTEIAITIIGGVMLSVYDVITFIVDIII